MEQKELIEILSNIQFKQYLEWWTYVFILCSSGLGVFFGAYLKESGKQYATKENIAEIKSQLKETTSIVEGVKSMLSERTWVNQQIWMKKQEAYEKIFESLFHIRRYISHQADAYDEWNHANYLFPELAYEQYDDGQLARMWKHEKEEYEKKTKNPEEIVSAQELKIRYEASFETIFMIIEVKAIYLDPRVGSTVASLKSEIGKTYEYEGWDEHFFRVKQYTEQSIESIKDISKAELKIKT